MLKRNEIIKMVKEMNLPDDEYWITAGAALVMHGVKDNTNDIDLGCTARLFNQLLERGYKYRVEEVETAQKNIKDTIEL